MGHWRWLPSKHFSRFILINFLRFLVVCLIIWNDLCNDPEVSSIIYIFACRHLRMAAFNYNTTWMVTFYSHWGGPKTLWGLVERSFVHIWCRSNLLCLFILPASMNHKKLSEDMIEPSSCIVECWCKGFKPQVNGSSNRCLDYLLKGIS